MSMCIHLYPCVHVFMLKECLHTCKYYIALQCTLLHVYVILAPRLVTQLSEEESSAQGASHAQSSSSDLVGVALPSPNSSCRLYAQVGFYCCFAIDTAPHNKKTLIQALLL